MKILNLINSIILLILSIIAITVAFIVGVVAWTMALLALLTESLFDEVVILMEKIVNKLK